MFFRFVEYLLEFRFRHTHNDVGKHLYKPSVAVECKTFVAGKVGDAFYRNVVEPEVEYGIHHARHRHSRSRTDGYEQRIIDIAEFLAVYPFRLGHPNVDLFQYIGRYSLSVFIIPDACFGGNCKTLRYRQSQPGHLGKP